MSENIIIEKLDFIINLIQDSKTNTQENFTIEEAAVYLSISKSFLYKLTSTNLISFNKPSGKKIYFQKTDLDNYLHKNKENSTTAIENQANKYISNK